jgi:hypothetical protein
LNVGYRWMNENRAYLELYLQAKIELMEEKLLPVQLCPPQIIHGPVLESVRPWEGEWTIVMENTVFTHGNYSGEAYIREWNKYNFFQMHTVHLDITVPCILILPYRASWYYRTIHLDITVPFILILPYHCKISVCQLRWTHGSVEICNREFRKPDGFSNHYVRKAKVGVQVNENGRHLRPRVRIIFLLRL